MPWFDSSILIIWFKKGSEARFWAAQTSPGMLVFPRVSLGIFHWYRQWKRVEYEWKKIVPYCTICLMTVPTSGRLKSLRIYEYKHIGLEKILFQLLSVLEGWLVLRNYFFADINTEVFPEGVQTRCSSTQVLEYYWNENMFQ